MSTLVKYNNKISELIYLLKQETKILSSGKLTGLQDLIVRKKQGLSELEVLTSELNDSQNFSIIAPQVEQLKRFADENAVMLKSVLNGLRSAHERLRALQLKESQVGAYDHRGEELLISGTNIFSEKRV